MSDCGCDSGDTGGGCDSGDTGGGCDSGDTGGGCDSGDTGGGHHSGDVAHCGNDDSAHVDTTSIDLHHAGLSGWNDSANTDTTTYFDTGYNNYSGSAYRSRSQPDKSCGKVCQKMVIGVGCGITLVLIVIFTLGRN